MKQICLTAIVLLTFTICFAAPKIRAVTNNGLWKNASTWDLNRKPQARDTVIIPAGRTIVIDNNQTLDSVYIMVQGSLRFTNIFSWLSLDETSTIVIANGGSVVGTINYFQYIFLGNATVFSGNVVTGPKVANANSGSGFINIALPVKFLGFEVGQSGSAAQLQWSTTEEVNADRFEIERSYNGQAWATIGSVKAKGSLTDVSSYTYTDRAVGAGIAYYRIKQVDIDGRYILTAVKVLKLNEGGEGGNITISTHNGKLVLQFPAAVRGKATVRVYNLGGQAIGIHHLNNVAGTISLDPQVKGGVVVVSVEHEGSRTAKKVFL